MAEKNNKTADTVKIVLALVLCLISLAFSIVLQKSGYLTYLNGDMSSEMILARRQVDTGSLVQMDWQYSTEIHSIHMNLFYALAFFFTSSWKMARIIGNTLVFIIGMGTLVYLCRTLRLRWFASIMTAALLPVTAGTLYAANMTIGGYYIIHLPFAFGLAALWLRTNEKKLVIIPFLLLCFLEGFLSVRYVLCFIGPIMLVGIFEALQYEGKIHLSPFVIKTMAGGFACVVGYGVAEWLTPRLFVSGVGAASSFAFNPLDGPDMVRTISTVFADFLKLLGWRGGEKLLSGPGVVDCCIVAVLALGSFMLKHSISQMKTETEETVIHMRMMKCALWAMLLNLFCFVFLRGAYLNRYLVVAALYLIPILPVIIRYENRMALKSAFILLLVVHLSLASVVFLKNTRAEEIGAVDRSADLVEVGQWLRTEGYEKGYGTHWNIRILEEYTEGALEFSGFFMSENEEGAICSISADFSHWLEPVERSTLDWSPDRTFLMLTKDETAELEDFLLLTKAPCIFENATYNVFGFENSDALVSKTLLAKAKLENAAWDNGQVIFKPNGRFRIPSTQREKGKYVISFTVSGKPSDSSLLGIYHTSAYDLLTEQQLVVGENEISFELPSDDPYWIVLIRSGEEKIGIADFSMRKCE